MKFKILLFIYTITISSIYAQNTSHEILKESYATIYNKINASDEDSIKQRFLLEAFMQKARVENNWKQIVQGYKNYLHQSPKEQMIVYADSMVYSALDSKDTHLIASAYLTKGLTYYWYKQYGKALDNYILSNKYLQKSNSENSYLKNKLSYNMGLIKYFLEQYDEALSDLKSVLEYFEIHNRKAYLVTLHLTGHCYRSLGNFIMCSKINRQGIEKGKALGDRSMEVYFRESEGINQYYKRNYQVAIDSLEKVIPTIEKLGDFANVTLAHYYIGKSYWDLDQQQTAIPYLKLVDQSITKNKYIKEEILDTYTMLAHYFKSIGDSTTYLHYIEKQIQVINTLMHRKNNLFPIINKEYDQANIIKKNEKTDNIGKALKQPEHKKGLLWTLIAGSSLLLALILWYFYKKIHLKKTKQKKFKQSNKQKANISSITEVGSKIDISKATKKSILEQLETFEKEEKYLDKNLSLDAIAAAFDTNSKYISQIIKQERKKKFPQYINDLRIDWLVESLRRRIEKGEDDKTPISKLAENSGFTSIQSFTKYFKLKTGMTVSSFIRKLRAEQYLRNHYQKNIPRK